MSQQNWSRQAEGNNKVEQYCDLKFSMNNVQSMSLIEKLKYIGGEDDV